jgi:hypothetical protein
MILMSKEGKESVIDINIELNTEWSLVFIKRI